MRIKEHLSWTQLNTLEKSEKEYIKYYIDGKKMPINRGMALGSEFAEALGKKEATGNIIMDFVISNLPKYEINEKEIKTEIKVDGVSIPILSFLDLARADLSAFIEIKTGQAEWTQKKVDNFGQITFYCMAIKEITGKIPADIELIWAPTSARPDSSLFLTGEIKRFKTKRTAIEILKMKSRAKKAWLRIEELINEKFL